MFFPFLYFLHRCCCLCACFWWWSLTCCPEWVERLPMVYMSFSKPMLPTSTAPRTGTLFSLCWNASVLVSNLQLHCRSPAAALTVTQVKSMSCTLLNNYADPAVQGAWHRVVKSDVVITKCMCSPGAQSDSEVSSYHQSEVTLDRGYTSDSEVYTEYSKPRIPRSATEVEVGWLVVSTGKNTTLFLSCILLTLYIV